MEVRFAPPELQALDRERGGTLVVTAHTEDRPLRGLAGRVDWRLCGQLSELLADGALDAGFGGALLCPVTDRLPFSRLLFVGLGTAEEFDAGRYAEACHIIAWKLARMGEHDVAMALPGAVGRGLGLREAVWGWRHGIIRSYDSAGLRALRLCMLVERAKARELRGPLLAVAEEVNEALSREAEQRAIVNAPPMPEDAPQPREMPEDPGQTTPPGGRRGWQSGVMKIGPATARAKPRPKS